jgi:exopolysaccharide biosynthesis polyprenyl glycosylphosphotransferase
MISNKWRIWKYTAKVFDLCVFTCAFLFAAFVMRISPTGMMLSEFMMLRITLGNALLFTLLLITWHNMFILSGLYVSKRLTLWTAGISEVCKATLVASAVLFLVSKVLHVSMVTLKFVAILWLAGTAVMVCGRLIARGLLLILRRHGHNRRHLLIVGTNKRAIEFSEWINARPEFGYQIVGFVDDDWAGIAKFESTGRVRCSTFAKLAEFLRHQVVDEVAIYLPLRSYYENAAKLVSICEQHGIVIRVDSQIFKSKRQDAVALDLEENTQFMVIENHIKAWHSFIKRTIDCIGSAVLLVLLAPVFLIVAILVKATSPGPIIFRQTRVGLNKRMFSIYKFRTMIADAEKVQDQLLAQNEMSGPVFKMKEDPRTTPLGRILRKTSIDELPQLLNVLKGEMSLVGPRAMSLRDYQLFDMDWHRRRFSVRPGITCLWQIYGRNSIPFEQWMELDLQYIDKWSLWLDLTILVRTVPAVLRGTGAA